MHNAAISWEVVLHLEGFGFDQAFPSLAAPMWVLTCGVVIGEMDGLVVVCHPMAYRVTVGMVERWWW